MCVEDIIIETIIKNHPEITSINTLYLNCSPHGQALVERKCRLIREKGRIYKGQVYHIEVAGVDSKTRKITHYRLKENPVKVKLNTNCFQAVLI